MMQVQENATPARPYSLLAPVYDSMMRHVNYVEWADFFENIFRRSDSSVLDVCDIACGTGSLLMELYQKGYVLSGADVSPEMIAVARKKSERLGLDIRWKVGSMLTACGTDRFDAVICTFDSMNYLTTEQDWMSCFAAVNTMLRPSGLFVFDVSTEKNSVKNFDQVMELDRLNRFKRISLYDPVRRIQTNRIELTVQDRVFVEEHRQRIYATEEIVTMISKTFFSLTGQYDHLTFKAGTEDSERIHFVLKKIPE